MIGCLYSRNVRQRGREFKCQVNLYKLNERAVTVMEDQDMKDMVVDENSPIQANTELQGAARKMGLWSGLRSQEYVLVY